MTQALRTAAIWSMLLATGATPALAQTTPAPAQAKPSDDPEPNPGRPTVSTPATLTPIGYLQFENGVLFARTSGGFSSQLSFNQVTKLTVQDRVQLLLLMEPFAHTRAGGAASNNFGGIGAGVQVVLAKGDGARPTISASYLHPMNGGSAANIDIGSADQSALVLVSSDLGGFHVDVNGIFNQQHDDNQTRWQNGETLSVSHPAGTFTIAVELWRFSQPLTDGSCAGLLFALSHPAGKFVVVDAGFNKGLTTTSTHWEFFGGFTYLLPHRLW